MSAQFDATATTGLATNVGATKTFFFVDAAASGSAHGSLQDGGTAPTVASTATGWTTSTVATANYSNLVYATTQAAGTFGTTPLPSGAPTTTNCFRTQVSYVGNFASGNWAFSIPLIATIAQTGTVHLRARVWRSTDPTGQTNVNEITTATLTLTNAANLTIVTAQRTTVTWAAPAFTLDNEYLFVELALEVTVASTVGAACVIRVGNVTPSIASITTTLFVPALPTMAGTMCAFARMNPALGGCIFNLSDGVTGGFNNCINVRFDDDGGAPDMCSLVMQYQGSGAVVRITPVSTIPAGDWIFVATVCDSLGNVTTYWKILGSPSLQQGSGGVQAITPFIPLQLQIGSDGSGGSGGDFLGGEVAGMRVWSGVQLSIAELEFESEQWATPIRVQDVWDYWPFAVLQLNGAGVRGTALHLVSAGHVLLGQDPPVQGYKRPTELYFADSVSGAKTPLLFFDNTL